MTTSDDYAPAATPPEDTTPGATPADTTGDDTGTGTDGDGVVQGTTDDGTPVTDDPPGGDADVTDPAEALAAVEDDTPDSVASPADNADLEHTEGGTTTRMDATDLGVPMLPGSPDEPVGPEDALGPGPTRGDYRDRIGPSGYHPTQTVRIPDAKPGEPHTRVVDQRQFAEEIGDEPGKGGVTTEAASSLP